jgi:hypothetical protein
MTDCSIENEATYSLPRSSDPQQRGTVITMLSKERIRMASSRHTYLQGEAKRMKRHTAVMRKRERSEESGVKRERVKKVSEEMIATES